MTSPDPEQLTMSRGLLDDFKKYAARDRTKEIIELLEDELDPNLTKSIKLIRERYEI